MYQSKNLSKPRIDMNSKNNKNESLIEHIDSLIGELNIVRHHVLNNDLQTASEYTHARVTGSEELRDKIEENDNEDN